MIGTVDTPPRKGALFFSLIIALAVHGLVLSLSLPKERISSTGNTLVSIVIVSPDQASAPPASEHVNTPVVPSGSAEPLTPRTQTVVSNKRESHLTEVAVTEHGISPPRQKREKEKEASAFLSTPRQNHSLQNEGKQKQVEWREDPSLPTPSQGRDIPASKTDRVTKNLSGAVTWDEGYRQGATENGISENGAGATTVAIPKYKENPPPVYPRLAKKKGYEGRTVLEVEVFEDGTVGTVTIETTSGYEILDRAALKSVREWVFLPGTENGNRIRQVVLVPVRFQLQ